MRRFVMALAVVVLVVGSVVAIPAVAQPATGTQHSTGADEGEVTPGEQLSGVVNVQGSELEEEVDARTFGIRVANADSDEERAELVAQRLDENEQRLDENEQRLNDLQTARESGEISPGRYAAEVAHSYAELQRVQRSVNETAAVAEGLPEGAVDQERIKTLRERAHGMSGPEIAELARSIAGPTVDRPPADRPLDRPAVDRPSENERSAQTGNDTDQMVTERPNSGEGETDQDNEDQDDNR